MGRKLESHRKRSKGFERDYAERLHKHEQEAMTCQLEHDIRNCEYCPSFNKCLKRRKPDDER